MKYCPVCGNASEDNEMFCNSCGTKLPAVQNAAGAQNATGAQNAPAAPVKKKSKKKIIIPIVIILVLLLVGGIVLSVGGIALAIHFVKDKNPSAVVTTTGIYEDETAAAEETTEAAEETTEAEKTSITRGEVDGNVYTNESVQLAFTPDSSWVFYTDEQIAEVLQTGLDVMYEDNFSAALVEKASMIDMLAENRNTGSSVNVTFENLVLTGGKGLSDERYYDAVIAQFEAVSGMEISDVKEMTYTTIGDHEYASFDYTMTTNGTAVKARTLFRKADTHMVIIAISTIEESLDDIEALFR